MVLRSLARLGVGRSEGESGKGLSFYVNEDKPTNRARIHRDNCPHAANRSKSKQNGGWYGPFDTKDEALRVARNTGRRDVKECPVCKP